MKVEMIDSVSMANGNLVAKRIYDLEPSRAKKLVARGLARLLEESGIERPILKRRVTSLPHGDKG